MAANKRQEVSGGKLDPVTFEVLKNSFSNLVDQMTEQILRTCYSFVIFNRDFSSCLNDATGDTVMQGTHDIAVHVGTLHFTTKSVIEYFKDELYPGDVIAINDPYLGGTHFTDVRIMRPIFVDGELIAWTQSNGHWSDAGGAVPGSFNILAKEHYAEGLRITPVKVWERGKYRRDVADMMASNMRVPEERLGDLRAQAEAAKVGEEYLLRLMRKYRKDVVLQAFRECQDYVERLTRAKVQRLPHGVWETDDYIDMDPDKAEGLVRVHLSLTIKDDGVFYDLAGSDEYVGCFLNATYGSAYSAIIAGTKTFFPEIPLNSGFYRVVKANLPKNTVVNAPWPIAVTGFCSGAYEKIMNSVFELWSGIIPERAMACAFNLEYLLVGGWDKRPGYSRHFMWYDWMVGGWGGRNGRDGANASAPVFGAGLTIQPLEGQERLSPVITTRHEIVTDSGGPGKWRGGCGVEKGCILTQATRILCSYCCDRERSIAWGIRGGLSGIPHGAWLNPNLPGERYLGAVFSAVPLKEKDVLTRPSSGGGGYGDPLERDPKLVLEDVIDGYVSIERARRDYGVVVYSVDPEVCDYGIDWDATRNERARIRERRVAQLDEDPEVVASRFRKGEIDLLDVVRHFGVIIDRRTMKVLPRTTQQFRQMLKKRTGSYWT
ncbi:MAG: hydantoinase B/oxoprolinase family protein [Candidatus Bathyarchaeia archaeon]